MAAVEITLPRRDKTSNIHSFSVQEDATPIDPSSSQGGVGTITVAVDDFPDATLMVGGLVLADGSRGKTSGIIRTTEGSDGVVNVTADSVLGLFNTERTIPPYVGTFGGAVQAYCDLVDIPNDVFVDPSIASRSVVYPGGRSNVWVRVKQMMAAEQVEMALVYNRIYVRPLRLLEADTSRMTSEGWSLGNESAARTVEINYYNSVSGSQMEVYPTPGEDPQIIVVDAGQTQVIQHQMSASLTEVNQPVATYNVPDTSYDSTLGVYSVTGVDDLPIQPAQWRAAGGSLSVSLTEDPSVIEITVQGANIPRLSPFRIAMSSGASNYYNSLHITGTGVKWDKKSISIPTGAVSTTTSTEVGVVVDNPYIRTLEDAHNTGLLTAAAYAGLQYRRTGTAFALNRKGEGTELIQATVEDFNTEYNGDTIAQFNTEWAGRTVANFNEFWQGRVDLLWENQLFGNAPGARVKYPEANFRIENTTTSETSVQFTAALDTLVGDFNGVWSGETIADFNAQFTGYTCKDFSTVPLRRDL